MVAISRVREAAMQAGEADISGQPGAHHTAGRSPFTPREPSGAAEKPGRASPRAPMLLAHRSWPSRAEPQLTALVKAGMVIAAVNTLSQTLYSGGMRPTGLRPLQAWRCAYFANHCPTAAQVLPPAPQPPVLDPGETSRASLEAHQWTRDD